MKRVFTATVSADDDRDGIAIDAHDRDGIVISVASEGRGVSVTLDAASARDLVVALVGSLDARAQLALSLAIVEKHRDTLAGLLAHEQGVDALLASATGVAQ